MKKKVIKNQYEKPDYTIYPVRKMEDFAKKDKQLPPNLESLLNKNGGCLALFAPPGSGKSNFLSALLLSDELLKDVFIGGLYVVSPTIKNDLTSHHLCKYADLIETQYSDELVEGIFNNIMSMDTTDRELSCLVLDDCLGSIKINSFMNKFTSTVRHLKNLLIYSLQSVKGLPPTIRSNISATVTFYQPSQKQLDHVTELHSLMGGEKNFIECYEEATAEKYGFLWSDFREMKCYKWGGTLREPELLWSMYDENGKRTNERFNKNGTCGVEPITDKTDE